MLFSKQNFSSRLIFNNLVKNFPFLENFDLSGWEKTGKFKANRTASFVTSKYSKIKPTSIDQLLNVLHDPAQYEHQRFLVKGYILNFNNTRVQDIVKKVSNQKVMDFDAKCSDDKTNYIYHFIANVKDSSVDNDQRNLNVYILTNEEDQHLFDLWELLPGPTEITKWKKLSKSDMDKFEKRLEDLTNPEVEVKMVVELLITASGKAFFKLYDTIFA